MKTYFSPALEADADVLVAEGVGLTPRQDEMLVQSEEQ